MILEFWRRIPGEHKKVETLEMDCIPREGETVYLPKIDVGLIVHQVTYLIEPPRNVVRVLLK